MSTAARQLRPGHYWQTRGRVGTVEYRHEVGSDRLLVRSGQSLKIPVYVKVFPGSDEERVDLVAAVRRNCECQPARGSSLSVTVLDDPCPPHDLLLQDSTLKRLVFYRRWYRARLDAL